MIQSAYIAGISYYLPQNILTNEQLVSEFPEWTVDKVADKLGIMERHIVGQDETALDLAVQASEKFFEEHRDIKKEDIDFVLLCTQSPDYWLPTSACILQDKLGLDIHCGALDFNLGCSGFVYGLALAKGLIAAGTARNILLVTAETYTKHIHPSDKGNRTIFGDAAAATLVSTAGFAEIGMFSLGTDGKGWNNLVIGSGGARKPMRSNKVGTDEAGNFLSDDYLYMNGSEIFNFTLESVPALVKNTLINNKLVQNDIDLFVFHQANKYMLNFLRKKIKIPEDKFYYCLEYVGNTVSSTLPIALKHAMLDGTIKNTSSVLLAGFGVGYSWGGNILKFNR